jgi:hypothetical protein
MDWQLTRLMTWKKPENYYNESDTAKTYHCFIKAILCNHYLIA